MTINKLLKQNNVRKIEVSKMTGIPYSTLCDICSGKTKLQNCSAELVFKLAQYFNVSVESLMTTYLNQAISFEIFRSNVCHELKSKGDIQFIRDLLENDLVRIYFDDDLVLMSLYLLAMLDYLLHRNNLPECTAYEDIRQYKLQQPMFSSSIMAMCSVVDNAEELKAKYLKNAIPEFLAFNIVEGDIDDVA